MSSDRRRCRRRGVQHPGRVEIIDLECGKRKLVEVQHLPDAWSFHKVDGRWVPVTRIEAAQHGGAQYLRKYDVSHRMLGTCHYKLPAGK